MSGWDAELSHAFGILLGAPLDAFDPAATYALHHWDEFLDAEFHRGLDLAAMRRAEVPRRSDLAEPFRRLSDADGTELNRTRFGFDLGRSVFRVDDDIPLPGDVITALDAAKAAGGTGWRTIRGASFAAILARHGVDLADLADADDDFATCGVSILARVRTDGSLSDAMRAATWTMSGPDRLVPFIDTSPHDGHRLTAADTVIVEPEWEEALRAVSRAPLRDHLRRLCLTSYWAASRGWAVPGRPPAPPG